MSAIAHLSSRAAQLITLIGSDEFPSLLVALLKQLVPINDATIVVYRHQQLPTIAYFDPPQVGGSRHLDIFMQGAFLLDPYYISAAIDKRYGFFSIRQLAPNAFKKTEYYNTYYRISGVHDECGYLIPTQGDGFINISLNRTTCAKNFSSRQRQLLQDIHPLIETLVQQHWGRSDRRGPAGHSNLRQSLQSALDGFGNSVLTARECQVINQVLHGYSTKAIAQRLSIAQETVKLHKKHAYAKLDISSQSELFYLFLDALMSVDNYAGGDTLSSYL